MIDTCPSLGILTINALAAADEDLCPILPYINDTEENLSKILELCIKAKVQGIICFGMGLTLREGNREYFYKQLDRLFPGLKEQYIREYGNQHSIVSPNNKKLMQLFHAKCQEHEIMHNNEQIFQYLQQFEEKDSRKQMDIWNFL